jgi:hypothetical protein
MSNISKYNEIIQAKREEKRQKLKESILYTRGGRFNVNATMHRLKLDESEARRLLDFMTETGDLDRVTESGKVFYAKRGNNLLLESWRHDNDIYELVDELMRGW